MAVKIWEDETDDGSGHKKAQAISNGHTENVRKPQVCEFAEFQGKIHCNQSHEQALWEKSRDIHQIQVFRELQ